MEGMRVSYGQSVDMVIGGPVHDSVIGVGVRRLEPNTRGESVDAFTGSEVISVEKHKVSFSRAGKAHSARLARVREVRFTPGETLARIVRGLGGAEDSTAVSHIACATIAHRLTSRVGRTRSCFT